ncbi:MAG: beta-lactamase family protein [Acidobacteria bacterium]|nr:beta-lactamase family protein [Acidobacteriota bacterium]
MDGSISWTGAAGTACPDGTPMSPDTPYFIASVDKLYTATAILKLHERGQLNLDECVSAYLPPELVDKIHVSGGVDHSARITVRNLLGHTSGLADYLEDRPRGGRSMIEHLVDGGGDVALGVADAMRMVREDLTPHFLPQDPHSRRPNPPRCGLPTRRSTSRKFLPRSGASTARSPTRSRRCALS